MLPRLTHWPIGRQLGLIILLFCAAIGILMFMSASAMEILSGTRAYVGGEGLWSKSQKVATYRLARYVMDGQEADYREYEKFIAVPLGDSQARRELIKSGFFQREIVKQGFIQGRNHPDDIPIMTAMVRWFPGMYPIKDVLHIWAEGDRCIAQLQAVADEIRADMRRGSVSPTRKKHYIQKIEAIDAELMPLEDAFSFTLGTGARWLKRNVLWGMVGLTALMIWMTIAIASRIIQRLCGNIEELRSTAVRVGSGDYSTPLHSDSRNEMGELFHSFQAMIEKRQDNEKQILMLNEQLRHHVQDLEDFAYSIAHDLRTPLRSLDGYAALLRDDLRQHLDPETSGYIQRIREKAQTMGNLIDDLLRLSRLSRTEMQTTHIPMESMVRELFQEMVSGIANRRIRWTVSPMPSIAGDQPLIRQVWTNLIANALKFSRTRDVSEIEAGGALEDKQAVYFIRDNGVGFDMRYADKLFGVFQRLHGQNEFEGTGAGLSIVRRIVERHGGRAWAQARLNEGATFYFSIPT